MVTFQRSGKDNEVSINGLRYKLAGPVMTRSASQYPQKQITGSGEITSDSHPWASVHVWDDWRDGIGVDRMIVGEDDRRSWFSTAVTSQRQHLTGPPLATQTAAPAGLSGNQDPLVCELGGAIVAAYGTDIRSYTAGTDTWSTSRATLAAAPTDVLNLAIGTTQYLVYCYTSGYAYSSAIATWATSGKDAVKIAYWDNRLWGIDAAGQLWYTFTPGSAEVDNARLVLSHNDVITSLFEGRDAANHTILYCTTERFLYAHDFDNCRWVRQKVDISPQGLTATDLKRKAITWQDQSYLASSAGVINHLARAGEATVKDMGPDMDDGLPEASYENTVACMASSVKELIIAGNVVGSSDTALIMAWNGRGWRVLWSATATNTNIISLHVAYVTNYRLWFGYNGRVWYLRLNQTNMNPKRISGWTYASTCFHKTPWLRPQGGEVDLAALEAIVDTEDCTANETVKVEYAINYTEGAADASYVTLGTITTDGRTIYTFPDNGVTANIGEELRAIRFKLTQSRGSTTTLFPDMTSLALVYRKKLRTRWMHTFRIDLNEVQSGRSSKTQRANLLTAIAVAELVEVTFRDDTGNTRNIYCDLMGPEGEERTGRDETGIFTLTAIEQLRGA